MPQSEVAVVKLLDEADQMQRACLLMAVKRERECGLLLQASLTPTLAMFLDLELFRVAIALLVGRHFDVVALTKPEELTGFLTSAALRLSQYRQI